MHQAQRPISQGEFDEAWEETTLRLHFESSNSQETFPLLPVGREESLDLKKILERASEIGLLENEEVEKLKRVVLVVLGRDKEVYKRKAAEMLEGLDEQQLRRARALWGSVWYVDEALKERGY